MDASAEAAFVEFARHQWPSLVRAAVFLGARPHEADDLAQQTLVRCYANWGKVTAARSREAYVYRILLNQLRDSRRSPWWRRRVDATPDPLSADASEQVAIADAVHQAIGDLPLPQQEVVVLRYFVQLSEAQTAATLDIPAGTVKSRLSRALAQLASSAHLAELSQE